MPTKPYPEHTRHSVGNCFQFYSLGKTDLLMLSFIDKDEFYRCQMQAALRDASN